MSGVDTLANFFTFNYQVFKDPMPYMQLIYRVPKSHEHFILPIIQSYLHILKLSIIDAMMLALISAELHEPIF